MLPSPPLSEDGVSGQGDGDEGGRERAAAALVREQVVEEKAAKRARLVARARFGGTAVMGDGKGVERVDVVIEG
jgi:central kinetochore subunit Mis15/CHL4